MSSAVQTVLVVDDEPMLREVIARALAGEGYKVLTADSGHEALAIVDAFAERLSLIVTDLEMPGMGGAELATHLAHFTPAAPVLFISGGDVTLCAGSLGMFLAKPFAPCELVRRVRAILGRSTPPATELPT